MMRLFARQSCSVPGIPKRTDISTHLLIGQCCKHRWDRVALLRLRGRSVENLPLVVELFCCTTHFNMACFFFRDSPTSPFPLICTSCSLEALTTITWAIRVFSLSWVWNVAQWVWRKGRAMSTTSGTEIRPCPESVTVFFHRSCERTWSDQEVGRNNAEP